MLSPTEFYDIVSGRRRGVRAAVWRSTLRLAELPYTLAVRWRNHRYDVGRSKSYGVEVPVICVGNLTLGGVGKTPLVEWIARWLRDRDVRVTIVSRGYRAEDGARNDEALELEENLPDVPHLQNPDRVAAARLALDEFDCQVVLLDDGFQHRRLRRDLDIVLLDAMAPFGFGHVFPRGALREPLSGLRRAHVVVLTRADAVDSQRRQEIRETVRRYAPEADWVESTHAPRDLISAGGAAEPIELLKSRPLAAFCGIGNPAAFRHTLESIGYRVAAFREFSDHHAYRREDVDSLAQWASDVGAEALVCTHKDLVKLGANRLGQTQLWALRIGLELTAGAALLEARLRELLPVSGE